VCKRVFDLEVRIRRPPRNPEERWPGPWLWLRRVLEREGCFPLERIRSRSGLERLVEEGLVRVEGGHVYLA